MALMDRPKGGIDLAAVEGEYDIEDALVGEARVVMRHIVEEQRDEVNIVF